MSDERILPLRTMARRLGVTQRWLREMSDAGRVPHLKAGRRYLYAPDAVEAAVAAMAAEIPEECDRRA